MCAIHGVFYDIAPSWSVEKAKGLDTLVFVTEGVVNYKIGSEIVRLEKGDLLYIPASFEREWSNDEHVSHKKYAVVFEKMEQPFSDEELFFYKPRKSGYYEQRLAFLYEQWLGGRILFQEISENILSELLLLISQEKAEWQTSPVKESTVRELQEFVLANYRRNITIEELADIVDVTPNYVTVIFKEVLDITPIQYLHQLRINSASHLIKATNMSIKEVSEYLGYCDQSYFNRMFKKHMGFPPSQIKSKMQKA
ncbi:HTH-type transcriptional regulator YesS [Bacillus sp. THAF10]|nr:HTH-type transcriptional regulator YesS [Bacillus sp. THAF10]